MSLTHLPAPIPDLPPDGHIPAYEYPDPPPEIRGARIKRFVPTRPHPPMPTAELPPNFERYNVTRTEAARLIGVSIETVDRWVDERLIGYLRRPDGAVRFRLSDCYRAAGVPLEEPGAAIGEPAPEPEADD